MKKIRRSQADSVAPFDLLLLLLPLLAIFLFSGCATKPVKTRWECVRIMHGDRSYTPAQYQESLRRAGNAR